MDSNFLSQTESEIGQYIDACHEIPWPFQQHKLDMCL